MLRDAMSHDPRASRRSAWRTDPDMDVGYLFGKRNAEQGGGCVVREELTWPHPHAIGGNRVDIGGGVHSMEGMRDVRGAKSARAHTERSCSPSCERLRQRFGELGTRSHDPMLTPPPRLPRTSRTS